MTDTDPLAALSRIGEIHRPIRSYAECEHDADHGCDPIEVYDYTACSESFSGWACSTCCYDDGYPLETCPHGAIHDGVRRIDSCPTSTALAEVRPTVDALVAERDAAREALARVEADRDSLVRLAQEAITAHRDLHKIYGSTATCGGGIGGAAMTQHCGVTCGYFERHEADQDRWYSVESAYFKRQDGDPDWAAALTQSATDEEASDD